MFLTWGLSGRFTAFHGAVVGLSLVLRRGFRLVVNVFRIRIQEDFGSFLRDFEKGVFNVGFIGAIHGFSWGYRWFVMGLFGYYRLRGLLLLCRSFTVGGFVSVLTVSLSALGADMDDIS